jgi:hypothetical protein
MSRDVPWLAVAVAVAVAVGVVACREPAAVRDPGEPSPRCAPPAKREVVVSDGAARLERWDSTDAGEAGALFSTTLPDDTAYRVFRDTVRADGAELRRPIADREPPIDDPTREMWRREDHNAELVMSGKAGRLRPMQCLEALTFVPDRETIVLVLRRGEALRLYVGTSDQMFPPKSVYGTTQAAADVADGWRLDVVLHNHTVQRRGAKIALGMPTLSIADVSLFRHLVAELGLAGAWVTNGVFTALVPAADFPLFLGRD